MPVAYTSIASADKAAGAPVSTTLVNALDFNVQALAEGGAPFKIVTAALEDDLVATEIVGLAVGAIGSYAFLGRAGAAAAIAVGAEISGSALKYAGVHTVQEGISDYRTSIDLSGTSPGGIWKAQGYAASVSGGYVQATIFKRIS